MTPIVFKWVNGSLGGIFGGVQASHQMQTLDCLKIAISADLNACLARAMRAVLKC